jgi:O-antigen/teichoic acid export membrane protein
MGWLSFNRLTATRTGAAILERALLGAATFLVTIMLGRWGGPQELGLFILFFPLLFIAIALQESLITAPYTVFSAEHEDAAERRRYLGSVLTHTAILSMIAAALFAAAAIMLWALNYRPSATVAAVLSLAAPCVLLREFARRVVYAELKPETAIAISGSVSALQLAMMAGLHLAGRLDAASSFAAMGLSSLVVAAAWLMLNRSAIQFRDTPASEAFRQNWVLGQWSVATQVGEIVRTQMFPWLLAIVADRTTVGIFAACAVIAALPTPLHVALSNILLPQFVQLRRAGGVAAADRLVWQATGWLTAVMAAFFVVVVVTSAWIVPWVYGPAYVGTQQALIVLTLAQVVAGVSLPAARALFVLQRPDQVFASHLAGIVANIALGLPMAYRWGFEGAAYATLVGAVLKAVLGMWWYHVEVRAQLTSSRAGASPPPEPFRARGRAGSLGGESQGRAAALIAEDAR